VIAERGKHMDQKTALQMLDELRNIRAVLTQILERQTDIAQGMTAMKQLVAARLELNRPDEEHLAPRHRRS
jgi:hypothetical protein